MIPKDTPLGTKFFVLPIKYWEAQYEMREAITTEHRNSKGELLPSVTDDGFIYGYMDDYGHEVYITQVDAFMTYEEANSERERRVSNKNAEENAELDRIMKQIFALKKKEA